MLGTAPLVSRVAGAQPLNSPVVKLATKAFRELVDLVTQLVISSAVTTNPFVFPLARVNSESVRDALIKLFEITGLASEMVITTDNAT